MQSWPDPAMVPHVGPGTLLAERSMPVTDLGLAQVAGEGLSSQLPLSPLLIHHCL